MERVRKKLCPLMLVYTFILAHFVKLYSILKKVIAVSSALMAVFHVLQFKLKMNTKIKMIIISSLSELE